MSKHYICVGGTCDGVSETPTTCGDSECPKHGVALEPCECEGGTDAHKKMDDDTDDEE